MRIRSKKHFRLRALFLIILAISPFSFIGVYAATISKMFNQTVSFSDNPPDPSTFITANFTRLAEMANYYDNRYVEYHMPLNFSANAVFTNDNCTTVAYYDYTDNGALRTGIAITAWVCKYITAEHENNTQMLEQTLGVIKNLTTGFSMFLAVPNGGIGPNYSGRLARGWADPAHKVIGAFYFTNNSRHHNGTGIYSQYRWRGFTSNDEYAGYYLGLAMLLKYVNDSYVQTTVRLLIEQLAQYMINTGFLGIDWNGSPTGVDQNSKFFSGGSWTALLLKEASIADPQQFESIYYHFVSEEMDAAWTTESGEQETVANYYAYSFSHCVTFALLELEDTPGPIHDLYLKLYLNGLRNDVQYQENAWFNIIYLALTQKPGQDSFVEHDVENQLMQFDNQYHFPDRALGHANITSDYQVVNNVEELKYFLQNTTYGSIYEPAFGTVKLDATFYNKPLTVEYENGASFIWEKNPYVYQQPSYNPKVEYTGVSFTYRRENANIPDYWQEFFSLLLQL